jgi:SsrA-binding protein
MDSVLKISCLQLQLLTFLFISTYTKALTMKKRSIKKDNGSQIAVNKKARFDYQIQETLEAGLVLEGWEVKSLRDGRSQLKEGYVNIKNGEAWLVGVNISPLKTVSTHIKPDPLRPRKLLLHRTELDRLIGSVERKGFSLIPMKLFWKRGNVKIEIGLGKGKQKHDKRQSQKEKDWSKQKSKMIKSFN